MPRIQNRLTDRNLRALKPDPLRPYDLADGGDLYVRVETSGTVVFWLRYQLNGKRLNDKRRRGRSGTTVLAKWAVV